MTRREIRELRQRATTAANQIVARAQSKNATAGSRVTQKQYDELRRAMARRIVEVAKTAQLS